MFNVARYNVLSTYILCVDYNLLGIIGLNWGVDITQSRPCLPSYF